MVSLPPPASSSDSDRTNKVAEASLSLEPVREPREVHGHYGGIRLRLQKGVGRAAVVGLFLTPILFQMRSPSDTDEGQLIACMLLEDLFKIYIEAA